MSRPNPEAPDREASRTRKTRAIQLLQELADPADLQDVARAALDRSRELLERGAGPRAPHDRRTW